MPDLNAIVAWGCMTAGVVAGATSGLMFHRNHWLGGYASWRRRMLRLAHISFFGIGLINLGYSLTIHVLNWPTPPAATSYALAAAGILMPAGCYLAAWRMPLRHLLALPVACVLAGIGGLLWQRLAS